MDAEKTFGCLAVVWFCVAVAWIGFLIWAGYHLVEWITSK